MKIKITLAAIAAVISLLVSPVYSADPVFISEVFYDSPLNESHELSRSTGMTHHNGEFIELFNPTMNDICLKGWKISDSNTNYYLPDNAIIPSRSTVVIAYRYPNSGFVLSNLFPSISSIPETGRVFYQSDIELSNNGEYIRLINPSGTTVDQMSYKYSTVTGKKADYWNISAKNYNWKEKVERNYYSLQRTNFEYNSVVFTASASHYSTLQPTPLTTPTGINFTVINDNPPVVEPSVTPVTDTSLPVGAIPGQVDVSPTGAATYNIPVEVPKGINGIEPNINICYSSQAGYSTLGTGWNINGISAITRGGKNLYFDQNTENVKFDNSDPLYLDGQRLIQLNGGTNNHLCEGAIYATEVEDYSRVKILKNSEEKIYFEITTQDGKVLEFGKTEDSRIETTYKENGSTQIYTLSWKLNKATDTYGNSIVYSYVNSSNTRGLGHNKQISKIEYGGKTIEFNYIQNKTYEHKYNVFKILLAQSLILESITTKAGIALLNKYQFIYNSQDKLMEVKLSDRNNIAINSTIIKWGNETTVQPEFKSFGEVVNSNLSSYPKGTSSVDFVDINGDGYNDRVERWTGNSTTSGFINVYFYNNSTKTYSTTISTSQVLTYANYEKYHPQFLFVDINNDGKEEIVYTNNNSLQILSYQNGKLLPFFSDGRGVFDTKSFIDIDDDDIVKMTVSDVNHDSYADIIFGFYSRAIGDKGDRGYAIFFGSKTGLTVNPKSYHVSDLKYTLDYFDFGDFFDADGKLDMLCIPSKESLVQPNLGFVPIVVSSNENIQLTTNSNSNLYNFNALKPSDFRVIDIDNDGLSDMLFLSSIDNKWRLIKNSHGYIYEDPINDNFIALPFDGVDCQFVDINGDGLTDVVNYKNIFDSAIQQPFVFGLAFISKYNHTEWSVYINKGNGEFLPCQKITFNTNPDEFSKITYLTDMNNDRIVEVTENTEDYNKFNKKLFTCSDYNGDGISDLIITHKSFIYALSMPHGNQQNLVCSVTNGMGLTESVSYKNFSEYEPYNANEVNAKIRPLRTPLLIVDTQTHTDGSKTEYTFESPKYHTEGKGFLGFATMKTKNTDNNVKTTSYYEFNQIYFFPSLYCQSISTIEGDNDISYSSQINGLKIINSDLKRYIPYMSIQNNSDVLKKLTQVTTTNYDDYPNSLTQTTVKGGLTTSTVTTFTGPPNKTPYLPSTVITTNTQAGKSFVKQTNYSFKFDNTNPYKITEKTETIDPEDLNCLTTTYSNFDPWGHPQNINITTNGKTRGSTVKYYKNNTTEENAGQYLRSRTNVLNEQTFYNWNESTNLLDSETDARGNTTTYIYTGFGQLKETIYPDGKRKAVSLRWASMGAVNGAKYSSYTEISGNAPVTEWYDELGRTIQTDTYGLNNNKISVTTEYYTENEFSTGKRKGMVYRLSEPYFEADASKKVWAKTLTYDQYGRTIKAITPAGEISSQYNGPTTTVTTPENTTVTTLNDVGQVLTSGINGKTVTYTYYPSGLVESSTPQDGVPVKMVYNKQGKQTHLFDPNHGLLRSEYNGFGELTLSVQQVHTSGDSIRTIHSYKTDGRIESINRNGEITTYTYDPNINYQNRLSTIEIKNKENQIQNIQTLTYDPVIFADRVSELREEIKDNTGNFKQFIKNTEFDELGRIKKETFPTGYYTVNHYDANGNMDKITDYTGRTLWKAVTANAYGQITEAQKGGKTITYSFDSRGLPNKTESAGIINMSYTFKEDGNLWEKEDLITEQKESYNYDGLNRLTNWDVYIKNNLIKQNSIVYNATSGTIKTKSDLGDFELNYGEGNGKPHALTSIMGNPASFLQPSTNYPNVDLNVQYTDFNKIKTLIQKMSTYTITYGVDDQRRMSVYQGCGVSTQKKYYVGNYEEETTGAITRKIHYLSGAILISETNKPDKLYYSYTDYQGSLIALTDESGNVVERYAYDPWGVRRNPTDWTEKDSRTSWIVNRGYTGHEHLDAFGIINMNGRVYDPLTAQFFSPDPVLTDAGNWLDYNRYGYCLNNPFRYTDPSGYTWWAENGNMVISTTTSIIVGGVVAIATAGTGVPAMIASGIAAGAAGGFTGGAVGTALSSGSFSDAMKAGLQGAAIGGISGAFGAAAGGLAATAVGNAIGSSFGGFWGGALQGAAGGATGGFVGGSMNAWMSGASFGDGLISGLKGAGMGAVIFGLIGGIISGIDAVNSDANFWNGKVNESGGQFGKNGRFLDEKIPSGSKPTYSGEISTRPVNSDYGKYGWTRDGGTRPHFGVDFKGDIGDPVIAMYDGKVIQVGNSKAYGPNFVRTSSVINGKTYNVDYGHMSQASVSQNQFVFAGKTLVGKIGRFNISNGMPTHVHIAIWRPIQGNLQGFVMPWWR